MFFPRRTVPLELRAPALHGLRLSLNTPVVTLDEHLGAPARAAIVVHEEPDGRPDVTIAVRSLRSGRVVLYSYDGDLRAESSVSVGTDAALSFGEGMGFLFDDDELGEAPDEESRRRAVGLWCELMGGDRIAPAAEEGAELELLDAVEEELTSPPVEAPAPEGGLEAAGGDLAADSGQEAPAAGPYAPPADAPVPGAAAAALSLSKFRSPAGPVASATPPAARAEPAAPERGPASAPRPPDPVPTSRRASRSRTALARLKLVKRGRGGKVEAWVQKLLTSF